MEFRVGSAPARSVGFSHGNTTAFDAGSEPPLVSVCVCVCVRACVRACVFVCLFVIFKGLHCYIMRKPTVVHH